MRYESLDARYDLCYDMPHSPLSSHRPKERKLSNPKSVTGYEILSEPSNRPKDQTQQLRKGTCLFCGKNFLMEVKGRKRIWCSDACKVKAMRYRKAGQTFPGVFAWLPGAKNEAHL